MTEMTLAELARKAGVSRKVLEGMIAKGTLGSRRDGGRIVVTVAEASRVFPHVDFIGTSASANNIVENADRGVLQWKARAEAAERECELLRRMNGLLEKQIASLEHDKENLYLLLNRTTALLPHRKERLRGSDGRFVKASDMPDKKALASDKGNMQGSLIDSDPLTSLP